MRYRITMARSGMEHYGQGPTLVDALAALFDQVEANGNAADRKALAGNALDLAETAEVARDDVDKALGEDVVDEALRELGL